MFVGSLLDGVEGEGVAAGPTRTLRAGFFFGVVDGFLRGAFEKRGTRHFRGIREWGSAQRRTFVLTPKVCTGKSAGATKSKNAQKGESMLP